jgi:hypothetical protein
MCVSSWLGVETFIGLFSSVENTLRFASEEPLAALVTCGSAGCNQCRQSVQRNGSSSLLVKMSRNE